MQHIQNIESGKIFSPQPKRMGIRVPETADRNLFQREFGIPIRNFSHSGSLEHREDQQVFEELNEILSPRKSCEVSRPVPSRHTLPSFRRHLTWEIASCDSAPPRDKENPIIFDEFFLELNSACSTAENSPLRTLSPDNCTINQD